MSESSNKARYWVGVLYPESMIENWQEEIADKLEFPFAYCIHDKCLDEKGDIRKTHVHIMIALNNTSTYNAVLKLFSRLGVVNKIQSVMNVRRMYDYLIHDTDDCRKKGKYLYDPSERIIGNNFDIGSFEQLSLSDKVRIKRELLAEIIKNDFQDFYELTLFIYEKYIDDTQYLEVFESNQGFFNNIVKGNFLHKQREKLGEFR